MKTDLFQSCGRCWVFQICWHIERSTLTASSFRIWNSSIGIPPLPLTLFIVMHPKAHLTSYSRMSGSRWVIIPSWLSGSRRSFLYKKKKTSSVKTLRLETWFFMQWVSVKCLRRQWYNWFAFKDDPSGVWLSTVVRMETSQGQVLKFRWEITQFCIKSMEEFSKGRLECWDASEFTANKTWWMNEKGTLSRKKRTLDLQHRRPELTSGSAINIFWPHKLFYPYYL